MENSLKGLILAAGVIITCIVVGLGFYISREAKETAAGGAGEISSLNSEFSENDKTIYDGLTVSGNEVYNAVNKFRNDNIAIKVITNKSTTCYGCALNNDETEITGNATGTVAAMKNTSNNSYVNPNGKFKGAVIRDSNNTIIGIKFTQI